MSPVCRYVSVIIPTYNYGRYISGCLQSVLRQTHHHFEVIIVDDGSTDDTPARIQAVSDERIRYVRIPHSGNYVARNRAIEIARGDCFAFLDSDDIWLRDKLRKQLVVLNRNSSVGICFTNAYSLKRGRNNCAAIMEQMHFNGATADQDVIRNMLVEWCPVNTSTVMVRREMIERFGKFDTAYQNAMDYDLWLRILFNCNAYYLDEVFTVSRKHSDSISNNHFGILGIVHALTKMLDNPGDYRHFGDRHRSLAHRQLQKLTYLLAWAHLFNHDYAEALAHFEMSSAGRESLRESVLRKAGVLAAQYRLRPFTTMLDRFFSLRREQRMNRQYTEIEIGPGGFDDIERIFLDREGVPEFSLPDRNTAGVDRTDPFR